MSQEMEGPAITRRTFALGIAGVAGLCAVGGAGRALDVDDAQLRPPGGQEEAAFKANCLKCDRCRSICPQNCLSVSVLEDGLLNYRLPKMDFHKGYCTFCGLCERVCPTEALGAFDAMRGKVGIAVISAGECIAYQKGGCQKCVDACDYDALTLDSANRPVVDAGKCNGCGKCEYACPSSSFRSFSGSEKRGINVEPKAQVGR